MNLRGYKVGIAAGWILLVAGCSTKVDSSGPAAGGTGSTSDDGGAGGAGGATSVGGTTNVGGTTSAGSTGGTGGAGGGSSTSSSSSSTVSGPSDSCAPFGECAQVPSDCLALVDNAGKTAGVGLRVAQIDITAPLSLAKGAIKNVIDGGAIMNLDGCNLFGQGNFSWLLELDKAQGKLKMGGAKPVTDPNSGYCFVNESSPIVIAPATAPALITNGALETTSDVAVNMPVYLDAAASSVLMLPLNGLRLQGAQLSLDQNCIGKYNADTLPFDNFCIPDKNLGESYFANAGSLRGYIKLVDADAVVVAALAQSLCVLLSNDAKTYGEDAGSHKVCKKDGNGAFVLKGDWCSTTNSAATAACADAFEFNATFAASAVAIHDDCK